MQDTQPTADDIQVVAEEDVAVAESEEVIFEQSPQIARVLDPPDELERLPACPHVFRHPIRAAGWFLGTIYGIFCLWVLLAITAAIPIVNLLALGYLLEVEGRLVRTGKLRDAFPLLAHARRLGSIVFGTWLFLLPLRLLAGVAAEATVIEAGGPSDLLFRVLTPLASVLVAIHLLLALARGGSPGCFLRPIKNVRWLSARVRGGGYWMDAGDQIRQFVAELRLRHHFSLGVRGFVCTLVWLVPPTALFATLTRTGPAGPALMAISGGLMLSFVLAWLPFLQARFAAENRFRAMFELRTIRRSFAKAPLVWLLAVIATYVLSFPLYLLKIALPPDEAMWLVTLIFIAAIYPARIVTGWVFHRASTKENRAGFVWRWGSRPLLGALLIAYVFLLYFTPFIGEQGRGVLFDHHALLLPVPF